MRAVMHLLLLLACAQETNFTPEPAGPIRVRNADVDSDLPSRESPRFYFVEQPYAPAMTETGEVLMVNHETGGDVYLWAEETGLEWLTTTGAWFNSANDISADGSVVIGEYGNYMLEEDTQAAIWTRADGWKKLGALPDTLDCPMQSAGYSLSDDGQVATGLAFSGCAGRAFYWDATSGFVGLEALGNGGNRATRISGDGTTMVGFAQGDSSRSPAIWWADGSGTMLDPRFPGEFYDVNTDGSLAVGQLGTKAFRWTPDDGHSLLGTLGGPGESSSTALAICGAHDELIIGKDTLAGSQAFGWNEALGIIPLADLFVEWGLELPDQARLSGASACNPDLTHFAGYGSIGEQSGVWIAVFPRNRVADQLTP